VRSPTSSTASDPQHSRPLETQAFLSGGTKQNKKQNKTEKLKKQKKLKKSIKTPTSGSFYVKREFKSN